VVGGVTNAEVLSVEQMAPLVGIKGVMQ
jgi:hypothetical protein